MDKLVETVKAAELGPTDVAKLLNISRVTVSLWLNNHNRPHSLLKNRVRTLIEVLDQALQDETLPLSDDLTRKERYVALFEIVNDNLYILGLGDIEEEMQ